MNEMMYCPMCEAERAFRREVRQEEYELRGEKLTLNVPRLVCLSCGEAVVDEAFGDPTVKLYEEYRRRHGLLSPEQIRATREKYQLSQEAFAALLGTSPATLARYEGGSLQEKAYDQLLRACGNPALMRDLVRREGYRLSARQLRQVQVSLDEATAECVTEGLLRWWRIVFRSEEEDRHQLPLPGLVEFVERTDRFASLPEDRRADLFFVVAVASADLGNQIKSLWQRRVPSVDALRQHHDVGDRNLLSEPLLALLPDVSSEHRVAGGENPQSSESWLSSSQIRLLRKLAAQVEGLREDEAHHRIVKLASRRLLRSPVLSEWILHGDWIVHCPPSPDTHFVRS